MDDNSASPPKKRLKTTGMPSLQSSTDFSWLLHIVLPYLDPETLMLKVSPVNKSVYQAVLDDMLRRFQEESFSMCFNTIFLGPPGFGQFCEDHEFMLGVQLQEARVYLRDKNTILPAKDLMEEEVPSEIINYEVKQLQSEYRTCEQVMRLTGEEVINDDRVSNDALLRESLLREGTLSLANTVSVNCAYENVSKSMDLSAEPDLFKFICSKVVPFEFFRCTLEQTEVFSENAHVRRKRRLVELLLKRLLSKAVDNDPPSIRILTRESWRETSYCDHCTEKSRWETIHHLFFAIPSGMSGDKVLMEFSTCRWVIAGQDTIRPRAKWDFGVDNVHSTSGNQKWWSDSKIDY